MTAPDRIWLQYHGDEDPAHWPDGPEPDLAEVTWCWEPIYEHDICYVRADMLAETGTGYSQQTMDAVARERDQLKARLRSVAQLLIAEFGAGGPMDAEQAAQKAVEQVAQLKAKVAELERELLDPTWQHHAEHWEKRAIKAEARVAGLEVECNALRTDNQRLFGEASYYKSTVAALEGK